MRIEVTGETEFTTEIDVNIDDVMNEWFARMEEPDQGGVRRTVGSMLNSVTILMSRVSDDSISKLTPAGRALVAERLEKELARYQER